MALEKGDDTTAQKMKHVEEEKQRAERRKREANGVVEAGGSSRARPPSRAELTSARPCGNGTERTTRSWRKGRRRIDNVLRLSLTLEFEDTKDMVILNELPTNDTFILHMPVASLECVKVSFNNQV